MYTLIVIELLFAALILVSVWLVYYLYCFNYWRKRGVPTTSPRFPAGNIFKSLIGKENLFITIENYYKHFKKEGHKHGGLYFFNGPVYLPIDPEIIKAICIADFDHFVDRGMFVDEKNFPLSGNLFSITGSRWKNLRNKISPTFTSGKLKTMYEIFIRMTEKFISTIESGEVNIKYASSRFTADLIFSTAFGLEGDTLKNPNGRLGSIVKNLFNVSTWNFYKVLLTEGFQNPGKITKPVLIDRSHEDFFRNLLENTIKHRDHESTNIRKDFLQLLLEIRDKEGLSFDEILAQCFLFFLAGYETSSQTISYCIHHLAYHQDLQEKLRKEVFEKLGNDFRKFSYEDIFKLPYLDQVFKETLRLHPVLGFLNRICVKNYQVPGTKVVIEAGTPVLISLLGIQRDPEYFPDPLKFDPERFNGSQSHVPFTFLPFGDGPRFCVGARYGKLQSKLGIAALISQFKFFPSPKSPKCIELDRFSKTLAMVAQEGITVNAVKLDETE